MGDFAESMQVRFEDVQSARRTRVPFRDAYAARHPRDRHRGGRPGPGRRRDPDRGSSPVDVLLEGVPAWARPARPDPLRRPRAGVQPHPVHTGSHAGGHPGTTIVVEDDRGRRDRFRTGPIFANIVLDEINRATPKNQSAMLGRQDDRSRPTGRPGIPDPSWCSRRRIRWSRRAPTRFRSPARPVPVQDLGALRGASELSEIVRRTTRGVHLEAGGARCRGHPRRPSTRASHRARTDRQDYAIRLVLGTHPDGEFSLPGRRHLIRIGGSPRAAQALVSAARIVAVMDGRFAVSVEDVRRVPIPRGTASSGLRGGDRWDLLRRHRRPARGGDSGRSGRSDARGVDGEERVS